MKKPFLSESRKWWGHWWIPGDDESAIPGVLTYRPDEGLSLDLIGGFDPEVRKEVKPGVTLTLDESRRWPVLQGMAENREITLLDCTPTRTTTRNFGLPERQVISALTALVGVHLESAQDDIFTECHVAVEDLTMWSHSSVFSSRKGFKEWQPDGSGSISVKPVDNPSVTVAGTITSLVHEHTLPHFESSRDGTVGTMRATRYIRFQPADPWSLATARKHAKMVQDLLSLALHRPCGMLWMRLKPQPEEGEDYPTRDRHVGVYSKRTVAADPSEKAVERHRTLFTCEHIPFEEIWPRWYEVRERCLPASNMILGLRYAPAGYVEGRLLTSTGAAEVLQRVLGTTEPPIPADEFAAMRQSLLAHTPEAHRKWVREKLRNEVTLKERLRDLVTLPDKEAMQRLVPDVERWATVTTQARNDLTHEGYTRRQSLDEVVAVVNVTTAVVVLNLLQALGVPGKRQREIINDHPKLRQTVKQSVKELTSDPPVGEPG